MEKSHSGCSRTVWCVVNIFHKNGMSPLIITNGTICYSILYSNSTQLYIRPIYMYSVISVIVDWLPGNTKKWTMDKFVAFGVRFFHSWADVSEWVSRITHMNESCHTYFAYRSMDESYHIYEPVMSHIHHIYQYGLVASHMGTSHVTHTSHTGVWISHITHMNETCHTHMTYHSSPQVAIHLRFSRIDVSMCTYIYIFMYICMYIYV